MLFPDFKPPDSLFHFLKLKSRSQNMQEVKLDAAQLCQRLIRKDARHLLSSVGPGLKAWQDFVLGFKKKKSVLFLFIYEYGHLFTCLQPVQLGGY